MDVDICPYCKVPVLDGIQCSCCTSVYHASCSGRCLTDTERVFSCCAAPVFHTDASMAGVDDTRNVEAGVEGVKASSLDVNSNCPGAANRNNTQGLQRHSWGGGGAGTGAINLPVPQDMKSLQDNLASLINTSTSGLRESITSLKKQLGGFNNQLVSHSSEIAILRGKVSSCETRMKAIEARIDEANGAVGAAGLAASHTPQNSPSVNYNAEIQDQVYRSYNLLLYNLPSSESDIEAVRRSLARIPNLDLERIHVRRFSKPTARSVIPPVIVRFSTSAEVIRAITNRGLLPRGVAAAADLTPAQRIRRAQLLEEANRHNRAHPDRPKAVKFVRGSLALIDARKRQQPFPAHQ